jgi:hypothetical protein
MKILLKALCVYLATRPLLRDTYVEVYSYDTTDYRQKLNTYAQSCLNAVSPVVQFAKSLE